MFVDESHSYFSPNHALWSERLNGIIFLIFDMYCTVSLYVFASVANVQWLCKWLWDISEITLTPLWKDTFMTLNSITHIWKTLGLLVYIADSIWDISVHWHVKPGWTYLSGLSDDVFFLKRIALWSAVKLMAGLRM